MIRTTAPPEKSGSSASAIQFDADFWSWYTVTEAIASGSSVRVRPPGASENSMKKGAKTRQGMRREYDFSEGMRGKYAERYAEGTNIVALDPDVSDVFDDAESVNRALRAIADIVRSRAKAKSASGD